MVCQSEEKVTVRPTVTVGKYIYRNKQQTKEETKFMHDCSQTDTLSLQSLTQQTGWWLLVSAYIFSVTLL